MDNFVIAYLDNIVIFLECKEDHNNHVCLVLQKLCKFNLYVKLSKYIFDAIEIEFLGLIMSFNGVTIDPRKVNIIAKWPEPQSFRDIQVFNSFANFYCQFIDSFSWVVAGLSDMLKDDKKGKFWGIEFVIIKEALEAFKTLKEYFITTPLLVHFDNCKKCLIETDALDSAIFAIFLQLVKKTGQWHLVVF